MKALVTGATGFIGNHLVRRLCADGHEVRGLVRNPGKQAAIREAGAVAVAGDVTDLESIRAAAKGVDTVFHLASRVTDWGKWSDFQTATVQGTENVLLAAAESGVRRFVHMSTVAVYDDRFTRHHRIITEDAPRGPRGDRTHGFYALSKLLAEQAVWRYYVQRRLPVVVLRPALVYGPRDETTLPRLIEYLRGPTAMWVGKRNPVVDPIFVSDVVDCAIAAAGCEIAVGQEYNVAPDREIGVREFWSLLCRQLGIAVPSWTIPAQLVVASAVACELVARLLAHSEPPTLTRAGVSLFTIDRHHDSSKAQRELGWKPKVQVEEGIRRAVRALAPSICPRSVDSHCGTTPAIQVG